jgi:uncharacterized membrane protein YphA (DoxX/SURF4 family)
VERETRDLRRDSDERVHPRELRYAMIFLRVALGAGFLSAVADRFGLWGASGSPSVAWGNFHNFILYTGKLNPWCPAKFVPALSWIATIAETAIGAALVVGFRRRIVGLLSGLMALSFAIAMTAVLGMHAPLNYSVFVVAAASFVLTAIRS